MPFLIQSIIYFVPGPFLDARKRAADKMEKTPCPHGAYILVREVGSKQISLQLSRVSGPECCAEIRRRGYGVKYCLDFFRRPLVLPQADTHAHMRVYTHPCLCRGGSVRRRDVLGSPGGGEMKAVARGDWRRGGQEQQSRVL